MALNCGFCGTEIRDGYRACSACGAVLRRPPLRKLFVHLFLFMIAMSIFFSVGIALRNAILPYSELLASLVSFAFLSLLPLVTIWKLAKYYLQRRWFRVDVYR